MRDSLGGTVSLVIIIMFIVVGLGYMAYNINYTKAFRLKDKIISLYNENNGVCGTKCKDEIMKYAKSIGYATDYRLKCPVKSRKGVSVTTVGGLYCVVTKTISQANKNVQGDVKEKVNMEIITKIQLQIPVISNILDFSFFYVNGDTKAFVKE